MEKSIRPKMTLKGFFWMIMTVFIEAGSLLFAMFVLAPYISKIDSFVIAGPLTIMSCILILGILYLPHKFTYTRFLRYTEQIGK